MGVLAEHHFAAAIRDAELIEIWCVCGWMARTAKDECFEYLARHIAQIRREQLGA